MSGVKWVAAEIKRIEKEWQKRPDNEDALHFSRRLASDVGRSSHSIRSKLLELVGDGKIPPHEKPEVEPPSILLMDIETLPILGYAWDNYDTNLLHIEKDWCVLSWAAMWYSDDKVASDVLTPKEAKERDDKRICQSLWKLFEEADIIIAQNGIKFDFRKMNTRWWYWNMGKPKPYRVVDTLDAAKRVFGMTKNGLDYLARYKGRGAKLKTDKDLWLACDKGDKEALSRMVEYNEFDVLLLKDVYEDMRGYIPNHPLLVDNMRRVDRCPVCLDVNIEQIDNYRAKINSYKQWRCKNAKCRHVFHATRAEK